MAECVPQIETEVPTHAPSPALLQELEEAGGDGLGGPGTPTSFFATSPPSRAASPGLIQPTCCAASAENPAVDVVLGPFSKKETCVVLDWDDTLFPSSFVDRKKLIHARGLEELPVELQRGFAELEKAATRLVTTATQFGTVLIITNAQTGWVELCVSKFMPDMMDVLAQSVRVVSARSSFERFFPGDPLCWKAAAFAHELHQLQKTLGTPLKNVLSFGDSMEERTAVKIAAGQLRSRAKSVKFLDAPSPRQLHQQIEVVTNCLEWIWRHNGDLDVVLTLEQETTTTTTTTIPTPTPDQQQSHQLPLGKATAAAEKTAEAASSAALAVVVTPCSRSEGEEEGDAATPGPAMMHIVTDEDSEEGEDN